MWLEGNSQQLAGILAGVSCRYSQEITAVMKLEKHENQLLHQSEGLIKRSTHDLFLVDFFVIRIAVAIKIMVTFLVEQKKKKSPFHVETKKRLYRCKKRFELSDLLGQLCYLLVDPLVFSSIHLYVHLRVFQFTKNLIQ